jgi:N-acetylglutamate synthase-like GNAT family acetyltransferase
MEIVYQINHLPEKEQVVDLFIRSEMPRPIGDQERIQQMFENADLVITAKHEKKLVGVCRCITDWVWCGYLSDLAVDPAYNKKGIGKRLIEITKETLGEHVMILLLSVPTAMSYYPKVGFTKVDSGFIINRTK